MRKRTSTWSPVVIGALFVAFSASAQGPGPRQDGIEMRLFGGGMAAGNLILAQPVYSAGVEGAIRLTRVVAVTGRYAYDRLGSQNGSYCVNSSCSQWSESSSMQEFAGGFRFSVPNRSRVAPYAAISAGGVRWSDSSSYSYTGYSGPGYTIPASSFTSSSGVTKFAVTIGGGVNCRTTRRTGFNLDVSGVGVSFGLHATPGWFIRPSGGFYFRF